jgi:histidinol-phosphate aminotransferase
MHLDPCFGVADGVWMRRLGLCISHPSLARVLSATKAPYSISTPTSVLALRALSPASIQLMQRKIAELKANRAWLIERLSRVSGVGRILGGNDANFVLAEILDRTGTRADNARAKAAYTMLAEHEGVVVRYRGNETGCAGCLRVTAGTRAECEAVVMRLGTVLERV